MSRDPEYPVFDASELESATDAQIARALSWLGWPVLPAPVSRLSEHPSIRLSEITQLALEGV